MLKFLKQLFCRNHEWEHLENLYGDGINIFGGRSLWICSKCGACQVRPNFHPINNETGNTKDQTG